MVSIIYFTVHLVGSIISSFLVDLTGRRPPLMLSLAGSGVSLFANATFIYLKNCTELDMEPYDYVSFLALFCYVITYSSAMGTVPTLMIGEMFPSNLKTFALSIVDIYTNLIMIVI